MLKPLVIYHASCADGFGAAFAAWLKLGDEAEYLPLQYNDPGWQEDVTPDISFKVQGREVYILDFSFSRAVMDTVFQYAECVIWLDHHKTSFELGMGNSNSNIYAKGWDDEDKTFIHLENGKSGAYLAWEYFHPHLEVPMFIKHIDDYDRWQFKLPGTKAFNKALWSYAPWTFKQWDAGLGLLCKSGVEQMYPEGEAILRAHDQNVQSVLKGSVRACSIVPPLINSMDSYKAPWVWWHDEEFGETCGVNGLAANCPSHLTSDVGHELATQSGTFGLCWALGKDGTLANCSLRSNGDYDVSAIAKSFGGGGHRNAAGFQVDIQTLLEWLK